MIILNSCVATNGCFCGYLSGGTAVWLNMMEKLPVQRIKWLLLLLLLCSKALYASDEVKAVFTFPQLHFSLYQNYSSYRETRKLLFKARATQLNKYISRKKAGGQLAGVTFYIAVYDEVISTQQLLIQPGKKECRITVSGYPSIHQLYAVIDYACTNSATALRYEGSDAGEKITAFYARYHPAGKASAIDSNTVVWVKHQLALTYAGDSLEYRLHNTPLRLAADKNLPLMIKDRLLIFTGNTILVLKGRERMQELVIAKPITGDYDCQVYAGWINICEGGADNWLYTYNYRQNRFIQNPAHNR